MKATRPIEIRIWMLRQELRRTSVARELGVSVKECKTYAKKISIFFTFLCIAFPL